MANASERKATVKVSISEDQLQGSWMDSEQADRDTSRWTFAKPAMTFRHYSGRVTQTTCTLEGNTLAVHHARGWSAKEPWDETIELKHYSNDTLVWDYGTLVTLHRVPSANQGQGSSSSRPPCPVDAGGDPVSDLCSHSDGRRVTPLLGDASVTGIRFDSCYT